MKCHIIIPARYASGRLQNKLLLDLAGKTVLQHTYEKAIAANVGGVVIAADDEKIKECAEKFGAKVVMTSVEHRSGTERIAEAIKLLNIPDDEIIVNVQGDGPMIHPSLIKKVAMSLVENTNVKMATLAKKIEHAEEIFNIHTVKVLVNAKGFATYFSRAPIPYFRDGFSAQPPVLPNKYNYHWHIGLYAYRAGFVEQYINWPVSPWEQIESLEQLRVLWHDEKIKVEIVEENVGVDINTESDLIKARSMLDK